MSSTAQNPPAPPSPPAPTSNLIKSFLSGGFGGMCLVAAGHPLDLLKVRLQTSTNASAIPILRDIIAKDGLRGLYRGMAAPMLGATPVFALYFLGYDIGKRIVRRVEGLEQGEALGMAGICFAGGFSAIPATAVMTPLERVKVVLQVQSGSTATNANVANMPKFTGPWDAAKHLVKTGGVRSLYRGTLATLLRDGPGSVAWYGAYEFTKRILTQHSSDPNKLSPGAVIVAGGMAGIANWTVAIPPDVVKSKLQTAPEGMYKGTWDVVKVVMREEGVRGFFKGLGPAMVRAFPANAACFLGVEVAVKALDRIW